MATIVALRCRVSLDCVLRAYMCLAMALVMWSTGAPVAAASISGGLEATTQVSALGASQYSLPIEVPPGIGGMAPELTIQYSSQQGSGILGQGMLLSGLSVISRCPASLGLDGRVGAVNFNADDRFCLDGVRLVLVNGNYGKEGSEYRTESETWTQIIAQGTCGSGPCSFKAKTKAGWDLDFATSANGRPLVRGANEVVSWQLERTTDLHGNSVSVTYQLGATDLQNLPVSISYTQNLKNGVMSGSREVRFKYEERPDAMPKFIGGQGFALNKRMTSISTWVEGKSVLEYQLAYQIKSSNDRSLLASITLCSGQTTECLEPTQFNWQSDKPQVESPNNNGNGKLVNNWCAADGSLVTDADFNGDGRPDLLCAQPAQAYVLVSTGTQARSPNTDAKGRLNLPSNWCVGDSRSLSWTDFNGDRKTDVLCVGTDSVFKVMKSTGSNVVSVNQRSDGALIIAPQWCEASSKCKARVINFSGQGKGDLACDCESGEHRVLVSNGRDVQSANTSAMGTVATGFCSAAGAKTSWADFNGDGLADLFCHDQGRQSVLVSTGTRLISPNQDSRGFLREGWCGATDDQVSSTDFNGDGLADLSCYRASGRIDVLLSTGKGVISPNNDASGLVRSNWCAGSDSRVSWGDFNGDGLADAFCHQPNGRQMVMLSTGTQLKPGGAGADGLLRTGWCAAPDGRVSSTDFNGDGLYDIRCSQKGDESALVHAQGFSDLLVSVKNGLGGRVDFTYKPMTDDSIYSVGSAASYPTVDVRTPLYLVERYTTSDGQGNEYAYRYHYSGARTQLELRRWLGFQQVRRTRVADGKYSLTHYSQEYPITGFIKQVQEFDSSHVELSRSTFEPLVMTTYSKVQAVLRANESTSTFTNGQPDYTSKKSYTYDEFGNTVLLADNGDIADPSDDLFDCWKYNNDVSLWRLSYSVAHLSSRTKEGCTAFGKDPGRAWNKETDMRRDTTEYGAAMDVVALGAWDDQNQAWLIQRKTYDVFGNAVSMTDWAGAVTQLTIDPSHTFVTGVTSPTLANNTRLTTLSTFDPGFGVQTLAVDANGNERRTELDGLGRVVSVYGPLPTAASGSANTLMSTTHYRRENSLTVVEVQERQSWEQEPIQWSRSLLYVDGLARPVRAVRSAPLGGTDVSTETQYDSAARVKSVSYPHFDNEQAALLTYSYDAQDRVTRLSQPDGTYQRIEYLRGALKVRTTQAAGTPDERVHTTFRTVRNALTRTEGSNAAAVDYQYDPLVQTLKVQGPRGDTSDYRYDSLGRVVWSSSSDTGEKQFWYTPEGRLGRIETADEASLRYTYDVLGRVQQQISTQLGQPDQRIDYSYDAPSSANSSGQLTQIDVAGTRQTLAYDRHGQVLSESLTINDQTYVESYQYAPDGQRTLLTYPDGALLKTTYDGVGNPVTLGFQEHDSAPVITVAQYMGYTARNKVREFRSGNGTTTRFDYYPFEASMDRIKRTEVLAEDKAPLLEVSYEWNRVGQLAARQEKKGTRELQGSIYGYDSMGWLSRANGPFGDLGFEYDKAGNITRKDGVSYAYTPGTNKLESADNGLLATHDASGNVISLKWPGTEWSYQYSAQGQLKAVTLGGQLRSQFRYDANGSRLERKDASGDLSLYISADFDVTVHDGQMLYTRYINSSQGRIGASTKVVKSTQQLTQEGEAGNGLPQAGVLYFHSDNIGSSVVVSDAQGHESSALTYMPFGAVDNANSSGKDDFRPKFSNKELDQPTGLYYFGARYQNPVIGRFLQPDPKNQFTSPYSYAGNDPLTLVDPNGEEIITAVIIASTVIGATIGAYSGAAAVNSNMNPVYWDWSKGKTYAGIFAGAAIGAAGGAIGGASAEAGVAVGIVGEIAVGTVEGASFSAMGGGSPLEIMESALTGGVLGGVTAGAGSALSGFSRSGSRMAARGEASLFEQATAEAASLNRAGTGLSIGKSTESMPLLRAVESGSTESRLLSPSQTQDLLQNLDSTCSSFPAGTLIATPGGPQPIETIRVGQQVTGMTSLGKSGGFTVLSTHQRDARDMISVRMADGSALIATQEHPFWTQERGWTKARNLTSQDHLLDERGQSLQVDVVAPGTDTGRVYNFEVASAHNYFAGDTDKKVLVHNGGFCTRLLAMGKTPSKNSKAGKYVFSMFEQKGWGRSIAGNKEVFVEVVQGGPRVWKKLDRNIHMGHVVDAVTYWNTTGYVYGPRSPQVRKFMLDPTNYRFEWGPLNSSNGAKLKQSYRAPYGWKGPWP